MFARPLLSPEEEAAAIAAEEADEEALRVVAEAARLECGDGDAPYDPAEDEENEEPRERAPALHKLAAALQARPAGSSAAPRQRCGTARGAGAQCSQ